MIGLGTARTIIHDNTDLLPAEILDDDLYWKISLTCKRAGLILNDQEKSNYKSSDFNVAGQLKLSRFDGFNEIYFCDPPVDSVKIECELFGDVSLELNDPKGLTVNGFMEQCNAFFLEHAKEKKEAKGRDVSVS